MIPISFPSLSALRGIAERKLTGTLRCSWTKENVELYTRAGEVVLVTTRDAELYCSEEPITLVNIDPEFLAQARATQSQNGCPLFITLAGEDLILRDPALQLVQHYGQSFLHACGPGHGCDSRLSKPVTCLISLEMYHPRTILKIGCYACCALSNSMTLPIKRIMIRAVFQLTPAVVLSVWKNSGLPRRSAICLAIQPSPFYCPDRA